jgi:subtilisin family serine protease
MMVAATELAAAGIDQQFLQPRETPTISPWAAQVIDATARQGRAYVWVFFTDKGFRDQRGFESARINPNVRLKPRAAARRAKIGRDQVEFIDLPVPETYLEQVGAFGATLRHQSRWLNAASFAVRIDQLSTIADLPFVRKIRPVIPSAGYTPPPVQEDQAEPMQGTTESAGPSFDYGASLGQLAQINVPAAHDLGYTGQGVLVCMMDTGFRKDHDTFAQIIAEGRLIADSDFVYNDGDTQDEPGIDPGGTHTHGTYTWSTLGGESPGDLYGPAFGADFLLAKTEDIRSETIIEEDNWMAAIEWAEGLGVDVVSSSLTYRDWYVFANFDGDQAITTIAADQAAALGVVVCNSNGNSGPSQGTLAAPADADSILAVGAVYVSGNLAAFSSRGPTADGRFKPDVCAQGVSTRCAHAGGTTGFTSASGTSLSCPLVGGAVAVVMSARPSWNGMQVREALIATASRTNIPDHNFGYGIIDVMAAINYVCVSLATPSAPTVSDTAPCGSDSVKVDWPVIAEAAEYEVYENALLIYDGPDTTINLLHASGDYAYTVIAKNSCVTSLESAASATVSVRDCGCHADPICEGTTNVLDVVSVVNEAFRGGTATADPTCTHVSRTDVNCDCSVSVLDVVSMVNVAFRGADPATEFCDPCVQTCP